MAKQTIEIPRTPTKNTQPFYILKALLAGQKVTAKDAEQIWDIHRLAAVIHNLKKNYGLEDHIESDRVPNKGENGQHGVYYMKPESINAYKAAYWDLKRRGKI